MVDIDKLDAYLDKNYAVAGNKNKSEKREVMKMPRTRKEIEDMEELVGSKKKKYVRYIIVITGHTPTQLIPGNPRPGYIFKANNHIAMDCGACSPKGRLAGICLETGEEFYSR